MKKNIYIAPCVEIIEIDSLDEMKKITLLSSPSPVFVVFYRSQYKFNIDALLQKKELILALDAVQDPGNLGTIIRSAAAFNVDTIILTENTVDLYNPKCVRSTVGCLWKTPVVQIREFEQLKHIFAEYERVATLPKGAELRQWAVYVSK